MHLPCQRACAGEVGRERGLMLNEEKIRLMTGLAMFEKRAEKDVFPVNRYFKGDYVSGHMIRAFLSYTFSCVVCLGLWLLYSIEEILNTLDIEKLLQMAKDIGFYYVLGLLVYLAITWIVYARRYAAAAKGMKIYQAKLHRLAKKYENQSWQKESEGGKHQ